MRAISSDIQKSKTKLLTELPNGTWDFGDWQEPGVTVICNSGMENAVKCRVVPFSDILLQLFQHQIATRVLHRFMGLVSQQPGSSASVEPYVANSIVALARIDAFIATTVICLRGDGTDTVGDHYQKLYHKSFKPFVADAYSRVIGKEGNFVWDWAPQNLEALIVSVHGGLPLSSILNFREATGEIFVPSLNRKHIAVSWNRFH